MGPERLDSAGSADGIFVTVPGEKLIEGQVIELEDGTTAYIHQVTVQKGENWKFTSFILEGHCRCNSNCLCPSSRALLSALALTSPCRFSCFALGLNEQGHRTCDFLEGFQHCDNKSDLLVV